LPRQICHNDITPGNILVQDDAIMALLDFEFITVAARALDIVMALRTTMRLWENPAPLDTVRHFFAGYNQVIKITPAEIEALPMLMRLRSALPIIWWLGQNQNLDNISTMIGYHQNMRNWLSTHEQVFLNCVRAT
ncbi:MAG: phosphotransferase enzyme family protein, partial [Aggregatilineales bacterium]